MIKAVIFDMDGVLVESESKFDEEHERIANMFGVELSYEDKVSFRGQSSRNIWEMFLNKYGIDADIEKLLFIERKTMAERFANNEISPIPYAIELLCNVKKAGLLVGIATSNRAANVDAIIKINKIEKFVDAMSTSDSVKSSKPNPEIFIHCSKKLGVECEECVAVEDSHNGVLAAKRAGMKVVAFADPLAISQDVSQADLIVESLKDVKIQKLIRLNMQE